MIALGWPIIIAPLKRNGATSLTMYTTRMLHKHNIILTPSQQLTTQQCIQYVLKLICVRNHMDT